MKTITRKNVSFSDVRVRKYDLCIGDSPRTLVGVALSLDWTYTEASLVSVDEFETTRPPARATEQLKISACDRYRKLVVDFGVPSNDIRKVLRRTVIPKSGHRRTFAGGNNKSIASRAPIPVYQKTQFDLPTRAKLPMLPKYPRSTGPKAA